jgi:ankyrin repeat protein
LSGQAQDGQGNRPLHSACEAGRAQMAQMLLARGCIPAPANKLGQTPLHLAVRARFLASFATGSHTASMLV